MLVVVPWAEYNNLAMARGIKLMKAVGDFHFRGLLT
jgi:hypothetical protein